MNRTEYMQAAAIALSDACSAPLESSHAEALLGDAWDLAQAEANTQADFDRVMKVACLHTARMLRDLA